ncbi:MAG: hypothetical protein ACK559_11765, partial [bacterium]
AGTWLAPWRAGGGRARGSALRPLRPARWVSGGPCGRASGTGARWGAGGRTWRGVGGVGAQRGPPAAALSRRARPRPFPPAAGPGTPAPEVRPAQQSLGPPEPPAPRPPP